MLATETKVRTLEESLESVKKVIEDTHNGINVKVDQMKGFVQEVEGRFTQLERAVPERFHALEVKEETTKILINELATSIRLKFNELEDRRMHLDDEKNKLDKVHKYQKMQERSVSSSFESIGQTIIRPYVFSCKLELPFQFVHKFGFSMKWVFLLTGIPFGVVLL